MAFNRIQSMIKGKVNPTRSKGGGPAPRFNAATPVESPAQSAALLPKDANPSSASQPVNILPVREPQNVQPPMQPVESPSAPAPKPKAGQIRMPDVDEIGRILRKRPPSKPSRANKTNTGV